MKKLGLLIIVPFLLILSCETVPTTSELEFLLDLIEADEHISLATSPETPTPSEEPLPERPPSVLQPPEEPLPASQVFDLTQISTELYETTKAQIQDVIQRLDTIIRDRNYTAWLGYISNSYLEEISSPKFLEARTEELHRRDQLVAAAMGRNPRTVERKELKTTRDYFDNVVVPSRANDRVDDIDFISETKVRAYTLNNRGARLILYDLEIIDGTWKIIG